MKRVSCYKVIQINQRWQKTRCQDPGTVCIDITDDWHAATVDDDDPGDETNTSMSEVVADCLDDRILTSEQDMITNQTHREKKTFKNN